MVSPSTRCPDSSFTVTGTVTKLVFTTMVNMPSRVVATPEASGELLGGFEGDVPGGGAVWLGPGVLSEDELSCVGSGGGGASSWGPDIAGPLLGSCCGVRPTEGASGMFCCDCCAPRGSEANPSRPAKRKNTNAARPVLRSTILPCALSAVAERLSLLS